MVTILALAATIAGVIVLGRPAPLTIVDSLPSDGSRQVAVASRITVTFSRPVDESSVRAALSVMPDTDGLVSASGRRAVFTPRNGLRSDTEYTVTLGPGLRDRAGGFLATPAAIRFRTRRQQLVVRTADGRLLRATLAGATEPVAGPGVGEFAVSPTGVLAYVLPASGTLVIETPGAGTTRRIPLPRRPTRFQGQAEALEVRELTWAPTGTLLGFLGSTGDGAGALHLVRATEATAAIERLGVPPDLAPRRAAPLEDVLKRALADVVYGRDTFAFTPDGRGAIVRDRNWDFVVLALDGQMHGAFGPFLAVGNASSRSNVVAFVDVDPTARGARRQVVAYERSGRIEPLSTPDRDSHSPRFAHHREAAVFVSAVDPTASRYAVELTDLGGRARQRLTDPPSGQTDEAPRWSPDDGWISFRRRPLDHPEGDQVWLVPADGGPPRPLPVRAVDARWTP
jgi:hypothetical protein